jgi:hypothetical protein
MKAAYCLNGHFITSVEREPPLFPIDPIDAILAGFKGPKQPPPFCSKCGAGSISTCQNCQSPIERENSEREKPPAYCAACGKPYPWQESIEKLKAALRDSELNAAECEEMEDALPDVLRDTPKTESAALKIKRLLEKVGKPAYDIAIKVISDVASETAKNPWVLNKRKQPYRSLLQGLQTSVWIIASYVSARRVGGTRVWLLTGGPFLNLTYETRQLRDWCRKSRA